MALPDESSKPGQLTDLLRLSSAELEKHLRAALHNAEHADSRGMQGRAYGLLYRCLSESVNENLGLHLNCEWPLTKACQWELVVSELSKKISRQWRVTATLQNPRQQLCSLIEQACLDAEDLCRRENVWRFDVQRNFQQAREALLHFASSLDESA